MAKDPAFLFYSGDFLAGTQFFTDEQVGKYIRLMIAQHLQGHLPKKHMMHICKTYDEDIFAKFTTDSNGLFYNERLEDVVNKRKAYSQSRANNRLGKSTDNQTDTLNNNNNICETHVEHMENENEIVNKNKKASENLEERRANFKIDCLVFADEYGEDLVNKFFNYWTECATNGRKMRFEKEPTYEIKRRLDTFRDNQKNWTKPTGNVGPVSKTNVAKENKAKLLKKYEGK